MRQYANQKHCDFEILAGAHAWLSIDQFHLIAYLSWNLPAKFVVPYPIIAAINPVAFRLHLQLKWKLHAVFPLNQLKPTVDFTGGTLFNAKFRL